MMIKRKLLCLTGKYLLLLNARLSIINSSKHNVVTKLYFNLGTSRMFYLVVIQITERKHNIFLSEPTILLNTVETQTCTLNK